MTTTRILLLAGLGLLATIAPAPAQTPASPRDTIAVGATTVQRNQAARTLIPLLRDVRKRATSSVAVGPGSVPDSPFAGTQTTLFAFTISKRNVPVDPRVVAAMDRLIAWQIDDPNAVETGRLFDQWLGSLMEENMGSVLIRGGGPCDLACMTRRMATLDESWGANPRERAETRDGTLLDALIAALAR